MGPSGTHDSQWKAAIILCAAWQSLLEGVRGRESGEQLAPFETLVTAQPEKQGAVVRETESIEGMEGDQVEHGQDSR